MAGRTIGRVAQTLWLTPKPLKMFTSPSDLFFKWPKRSGASGVWVYILVISLHKCKVVFKWDGRERRFGRIQTERGACPLGELLSGRRGTSSNCATPTSAQTFALRRLFSSS